MSIAESLRDYTDNLLNNGDTGSFPALEDAALHCRCDKNKLISPEFLPFLERILSAQKTFLTKNALNGKINHAFAKYLYETEIKKLELIIFRLNKGISIDLPEDTHTQTQSSHDILQYSDEEMHSFLSQARNSLFKSYHLNLNSHSPDPLNSKHNTEHLNDKRIELSVPKRAKQPLDRSFTSNSQSSQFLTQNTGVIPSGRHKGVLTRLKDYALQRTDINNLAALMIQIPVEDLKKIAFNSIPESLQHILGEHENIPTAMVALAHAIIGDIKTNRSSTIAYLMELAVSAERSSAASRTAQNHLTLIGRYIKKSVPPVFQNCWDNLKSENIFYGGSSSGKSVFCAHLVIYTLFENSFSNVLICRNTSSTLNQSCINEMEKWLEYHGIEYTLNKTLKEIYVTINGNVQTIFFRGLDDPKKLLSITPKYGALSMIWVEEAVEINASDYDMLSTRLRGGGLDKRFVFSMNPISKGHWIYGRYFDDNTKSSLEDVYIHKSTYRDNPFLTEQDIKPILRLKETNPMFYEVFANGEWGTLGDLVFPEGSYEILTEEPDWDSLVLLCYGADFGILKDPTALTAMYFNQETRDVYFRELFYQRIPTIQDFSELMVRSPYIDVSVPAYCDTNPADAVNVLRNNGINAFPARKGAHSIVEGIQSLIAVKPKLWGLNLAREFKEYEYHKDKNGSNTGIPVDKNNHCIDACRYACRDFMHIILS